ncbi:MAG: thioredoxin-dependent thiol peroxidase [Lentimicrobiaceae bacterium]|nr:thioredoxin-dependent thiol peroxidase [Lentimicrobiaceae bacterium]
METRLTAGQPAPYFEGVDQHGQTIRLSDLQGKKLVLYFYPKDDTPGCTAQACNLRDNYQELLDVGYHVIGISPDPQKSHLKFIEKYQLPFPLIADTEKKILQDYGVWGPKKFMGRAYDGVHRTTFVVDERGVILDVIAKVDTKNHADQIIQK